MQGSHRLRHWGLYGVFRLLVGVALDGAFGRLATTVGDRSFRVAHPYYHHGLHPNRNTETVWGGRSYAMRTDSLGFRDGAVAEIGAKPSGRRVLLIGDSMIEGLAIESPNTAAGILSARGRARGVEVLNAAVVSYSPKLHDLKTRWLVDHEQLEFERLIVFIDISDIQDEINYEAFVPTDSDDWLATGAAWWRRHSLSRQVVDRFLLGREGIDNRFERDADLHVWMDTVDAYRNPTSNPDAGRWEWTYDDGLYADWGARGLAVAEASMSRLVEFCQQHRIEMIVAVYPSPFQIFANDLESRQVRVWRTFSERENVGFVNLFPAFIDPNFAGPQQVYDRYFISDDVHWNEVGHALVADRMEAAVLGSDRP